MANKNEAESALERQLLDAGIYHLKEFRFGADASGGTGKGLKARLAQSGLRDWRADFAILDAMLLIEIEGGGWGGGRHVTGKGFADDLRKYDAAARLGYAVYRCDPAMVRTGRALDSIKIILQMKQSGGLSA